MKRLSVKKLSDQLSCWDARKTRAYLTATHKWHLSRHDGGEQNIRRERQARHGHKSIDHGRHVHPRFGLDRAISLVHTFDHALGHIARYIANIDLTDSNIKWTTV